MTKEVVISIRGLQFSPENGNDEVTVIAPGEYYFRNDKHYFLYEEVVEGETTVTKNIVKVCPGYMELTKKGGVNAHMVFENGKKHETYYQTPFGSILMGVEATRVDVAEEENQMNIDVEYALEMNYEHVANCHIIIEVKAKEKRTAN